MGVSFFAHVQGIIQHATINNLAFGRNVEETLRILQAIQYVQENPDEVLSLYSSLCHVASRIRESPQRTCRAPRSVTAIATPALCGSCILYKARCSCVTHTRAGDARPDAMQGSMQNPPNLRLISAPRSGVPRRMDPRFSDNEAHTQGLQGLLCSSLEQGGDCNWRLAWLR